MQIRRLCNLLAERKMSMENEISKLQAKNLRLHRIVRRLAHMLQDEDRAKAHMPGRPSCISSLSRNGWLTRCTGRRNDAD